VYSSVLKVNIFNLDVLNTTKIKKCFAYQTAHEVASVATIKELRNKGCQS